MPKVPAESSATPEIWRFENYVEVQIEKHKADKVIPGVIGEYLKEGKPVVLVPVDKIEILDAEFEEVPNEDA